MSNSANSPEHFLHTSDTSSEVTILSRTWWTVGQMAEHYNLSPRTIYAAINQGKLNAHRFGGLRGIRIQDTERLRWEELHQEPSVTAISPLKPAKETLPEHRPLIAKHFPQ